MKIYNAMTAVMADAEPIAKDRQNKGQGYAFRGIDDVYAALQAVMVKHKVFSLPTVLEQIREERTSKSGGLNIYSILKIKYTFYTDDGSSVEAVVIGEGMDSGDKASNKGMSVAHKYALLQAFAIPTKEAKDPEHDSHDLEPGSAPPKSGPVPLKAVSSGPETLGDYQIQIGKKFLGKKLKDCGPFNTNDGVPEDLLSYANWLRAKAAEKKMNLAGIDLETVEKIEAFVEECKRKKAQ